MLRTLCILLAFLPCALQAAVDIPIQVRLEAFHGKPVLVTFWRSDCAPCVREYVILHDIAKAHPDLAIAVFASRDEKRIPAGTIRNNIRVYPTLSDMAIALHDVGDKDAALPFSLFLKRDGQICDTHYGLLGTDLADKWIASC